MRAQGEEETLERKAESGREDAGNATRGYPRMDANEWKRKQMILFLAFPTNGGRSVYQFNAASNCSGLTYPNALCRLVRL